ncbi:MAG TPA: hypothetical protein GX497_13635 [Bacillus bacterium]|nr:hypothetical protein [Bacillus sp. (in: firmicutes)]
MKEDKKFSLYLNGNWPALADLLKSELQYCADIGDSIQLACVISDYGCCQIQLGNQFEAHIIYQFLKDNEHCGTAQVQQYTIKEQAFVYRFLALYSLFTEDDFKQANVYYEKSMAAYLLLDEAEDEAIMLIEAYRWLYCLVADQEKKSYINDRLELICKPLVDRIEFEFTFHGNHHEMANEFYNYICFFTKNELHPHPVIALHHDFFKALQLKNKENAIKIMYSLLAKTKQYKHPLLKAWTYFLADMILEQPTSDTIVPFSENTEAAKLSFQLFKEFTIKYKQKQLTEINWKRKKAEELLIYLLIQPNLQVDKDLLLEDFYPEDDNKKAANRLYVIIHSINKQFLELTAINEPIISTKGGKVRLNLNIIEDVDIQAYLKLYSVGRQLWFVDREEAANLFEKARKLYDNQFVTNILYTNWLYQFRFYLKEKQIDLLQKLYSYQKNIEIKEELLRELIDCDPLNENTTREKLLFLHSQGRFLEAKLFYEKQKELFREELGLEFNFEADVGQ